MSSEANLRRRQSFKTHDFTFLEGTRKFLTKHSYLLLNKVAKYSTEE